MNVNGVNMDVHVVNMGSLSPVRARELTRKFQLRAPGAVGS